MGAAPALAQHDHHHEDTARVVGSVDAAMSGPMSREARLHMLLTPERRATAADSARARAIAAQLRTALRKYADTAAAVADGYRMFMPNIKKQRVYHFTNYRKAFLEGFRFEPTEPTSILYRRGSDGRLELIGAMYTAPKRMSTGELDERIPLSIARWHKHVNWCLPKLGDRERWLERRDGKPVFGPESPIATKAQCDAVGGRFHSSLLGWMIHANVFLGEDLATVYGHEH